MVTAEIVMFWLVVNHLIGGRQLRTRPVRLRPLCIWRALRGGWGPLFLLVCVPVFLIFPFVAVGLDAGHEGVCMLWWSQYLGGFGYNPVPQWPMLNRVGGYRGHRWSRYFVVYHSNILPSRYTVRGYFGFAGKEGATFGMPALNFLAIW